MVDMKRLLFLALTLLTSLGALAQNDDASQTGDKLIVATKEAPPFAFKDENDQWTGITIELWEAIANKLDLDYEFREYDLAGVLNAVATGEADVGAAAISVTADRAKNMDFTHTYYGASLGIATSFKKNDIWTIITDRVFTWNFISAIFALALVLLFAGAMVWFFERKHNADHFGGKTLHGLGAAFWWSAVTMTTVGYGDKAPVTPAGRVVGLIWMFTSIIIISGFTGAIATALTVGSLTPTVKGPNDLNRVEVGAIKGSVADQFLKEMGIAPEYYENVPQGLQAVDDNKIGAFVNDHAIISYWAGKDFVSKIDVLENTFEPSYLAFALPLDHPKQRDIDLALLEYVQEPGWDATLEKYRAAQ